MYRGRELIALIPNSFRHILLVFYNNNNNSLYTKPHSLTGDFIERKLFLKFLVREKAVAGLVAGSVAGLMAG